MIEGCRDAASTSSANSISQYRSEKKKVPQKAKVDMSQKGTCGTCGASIKLYKKMSNGNINKTPFSDCQDCWKSKNPRSLRNNPVLPLILQQQKLHQMQQQYHLISLVSKSWMTNLNNTAQTIRMFQPVIRTWRTMSLMWSYSPATMM